MKTLLSLTMALFLSVSAFAHTNEQIENELVDLHGFIEENSSYSAEYSEDRDAALNEANKTFRERLLALTSEHPSMLEYSFPMLSGKLSIETSPDGKLRMYSWDTLSGGTMHFYEDVFQFRGLEGVFSHGSDYDEGDVGSFVNDIHNIETRTGTVYLVSKTSVLSTSLRGESIGAFQIDGNSLSDNVKIFKTASGKRDSISFAYDFFSVVDRPERPIRLFEFDPRTKTLSFPVVIEDDETPQGRVTDKKIVYKFDGDYFVRK